MAPKGVTGVLGTFPYNKGKADGKRVKVKKGYPYKKKNPCPASSDCSIMNTIVIITIIIAGLYPRLTGRNFLRLEAFAQKSTLHCDYTM